MLMAKGTYQGMIKAKPQQRPFVLTRANYLGGQKWAATWTGDNKSGWNHLRMSIAMVINLGLSGQPFSGPDIGGFSGNADGKLFARWMGFGALLPFARGHTHLDTKNHEPWSFGPEVEETCRIAISRRYILLPYIYTLFHTATYQGLPVVRPLFFSDPTDPLLRDEDRAFLLGDRLMVVVDVYPPVLEKPLQTPLQAVNLPKNQNWTIIDLDGHTFGQPDLPILLIQRGGIIPTYDEAQRFVGEKPLMTVTLWVALNNQNTAEGEFYDDEGNDFSYLLGNYKRYKFTAFLKWNELHITVAKFGNYFSLPVSTKAHLIYEDGTHVILNEMYDSSYASTDLLVYPLTRLK
eukprot:TRINITY_DN12768_c0_g1_i1.p1 TRINITY_DN12768_c0_g1~~TRINITY_DN12768_c0_g1_i1.p1  ORF type:complete len:348 (+),score=67.83 TRINITY_DN12768_c0_g1_i1:193-1236(+)